MKSPPPSLPQVRQDLKQIMAAERDANRRAEIGRALRAIERAEQKSIDDRARPC